MNRVITVNLRNNMSISMCILILLSCVVCVCALRNHAMLASNGADSR